MNDQPSPIQEPELRIVYNETIVGNAGSQFIAQLFSNGSFMIWPVDAPEKRRVAVLFIDPITREPWLPPRETFIAIVTEAIDNGEYDFDGEVVCLNSFAAKIKELLPTWRSGGFTRETEGR